MRFSSATSPQLSQAISPRDASSTSRPTLHSGHRPPASSSREVTLRSCHERDLYHLAASSETSFKPSSAGQLVSERTRGGKAAGRRRRRVLSETSFKPTRRRASTPLLL